MKTKKEKIVAICDASCVIVFICGVDPVIPEGAAAFAEHADKEILINTIMRTASRVPYGELIRYGFGGMNNVPESLQDHLEMYVIPGVTPDMNQEDRMTALIEYKRLLHKVLRNPAVLIAEAGNA